MDNFEILNRIAELKQMGQTFDSIADILRLEGYKPRIASRFTSSTVYSMWKRWSKLKAPVKPTGRPLPRQFSVDCPTQGPVIRVPTTASRRLEYARTYEREKREFEIVMRMPPLIYPVAVVNKLREMCSQGLSLLHVRETLNIPGEDIFRLMRVHNIPPPVVPKRRGRPKLIHQT